MLDAKLGFNFNNDKQASDFAIKMSKAFNKYSINRQKILECEKCKDYIKSHVKKIVSRNNNDIAKLSHKFKSDCMDPFKPIVDDPSLIINKLEQEKDDVGTSFVGIDSNKLC